MSDVAFYGTRPGLNRVNQINSVTLAGCAISISDRLKILGVTQDAILSFDEHIATVVKACNYHLRELRRLDVRRSGSWTSTVPAAGRPASRRLDVRRPGGWTFAAPEGGRTAAPAAGRPPPGGCHPRRYGGWISATPRRQDNRDAPAAGRPPHRRLESATPRRLESAMPRRLDVRDAPAAGRPRRPGCWTFAAPAAGRPPPRR